MAWSAGPWMLLVRGVQLVAMLVCAGANGFLLAHTTINRLAPSSILVSLEWIVRYTPGPVHPVAVSANKRSQICVMLCYTALCLLCLHTRRRSKRTSWLAVFVLMDALSMGAVLSIITMLSRAGVPSSCGGLTRPDCTHQVSQPRCTP
jgi:hypothetical protein